MATDSTTTTKQSAQEVWKDIPDYSGYQASSIGRVRSLKRRAPKILKQSEERGGYLRVTVCREGKMSTPMVHRLVALAFKGRAPSEAHQVAHWNGDRTDNRPDNLRWATSKENHADRRRHGTYPSRENNNRAKLKPEDVDYIRNSFIPGTGRRNPGNVSELAARFGVTTQSIRYAAKGVTWK